MIQRIDNITIKEAYKLINTKPELTIIDARDISMFKSGHLPKVVLIDAFNENAESLLNKFDRNKAYLVDCTTSIRANILLNLMEDLGFTKVYGMIEGISKWKENGFPVTV